MPRYRLLVEYDGRPFCGFQAQARSPSVQAALERAAHAFSGEHPVVHAAGRTDTGVHATGQIVHIDLARPWRPDVVREAMNAHLAPEPVAVLQAQEAGEDFHARFSAKERRYLYRILNRRAPAALDRGRVWRVKAPLNEGAMAVAVGSLIGLHDFTTFRDARCQAKTPVKTLDDAWIVRDGDELRIGFAARSFLHRQVRSMVGSLVEVGAGRWRPERLKQALDARDRSACGPVAPPDGLYLTAVEY